MQSPQANPKVATVLLLRGSNETKFILAHSKQKGKLIVVYTRQGGIMFSFCVPSGGIAPGVAISRAAVMDHGLNWCGR